MAEFVEEKDARKEMERIGVEEKSIAIMEPKGIFRRILVKNVRNAMANIVKQDMLSIGGEVAVNRGCVNCTIEKSDILIMGTVSQIRKLVKKLKWQVSELPEIAKEIEMLIK